MLKQKTQLANALAIGLIVLVVLGMVILVGGMILL